MTVHFDVEELVIPPRNPQPFQFSRSLLGALSIHSRRCFLIRHELNADLPSVVAAWYSQFLGFGYFPRKSSASWRSSSAWAC